MQRQCQLSNYCHNIRMDNVTELMNVTSRTGSAIGIGTYVVLMLSTIGLIENGVVVVLLFTRPLLRQRPHVIFTLSLSCSDFLSSFIVILIISARFNLKMYSKGFCLFTYTASVVCFGTSLLQAFIISLERVLAISASSTYIRAFQGLKKYAVLLSAWLILSIYSVGLVISFPITGSFIGCVVAFMYNNANYFGLSLGTQVLFIPLVFLTLVLYAVAAYRLQKRMKQVSFTNNESVMRGSDDNENVNGEGLTTTTVNTKFREESCSHENTSAGYHSYENHLNRTRVVPPVRVFSVRVTTTTRSSADGIPSARETKILRKETCNIRKLSDALKTVTLVQLCLFVSFVPLSVVRILILIGVSEARAAEGILSILPLLHPVINPILYVWLIKEFRMALLCKK